ncbi:peptidylprolyl isomerase [Bacilliculturomica massiliensis]|uniref:peptidylprolyl isomerase n=1 Tax=Bacilliculturomica massiliensis TaxID=1917867 RepID=UPI0013EF07BA|nr:peptidylprolyl isomerase [Bacilliculturomica massiliensis]
MKCKKWAALLLAGVLAFTAAGCGNGDPKDSEVAASIEDAEITYGQLDEFLELSALIANQNLEQIKAQPDLMSYLKKSMLVNMVSYEAMRMTLEEKGGDIFPEEYQSELDEFLKSIKEAMGDKKISDETLTYYFNLRYYVEPFNKEAEDAVTDEDVRVYYDEHVADKYTTTAARGKVSHILVDNEDLANEIYDKIMNGADFGEMAAEYGTDGTKDNGGSLGVLSEDDPNYDADFMKGAFALKSGEVSKPVKSRYGYHLIKMEDREEAGVVLPFEDQKQSIRSTLVSEKYSQMITELVDKYKVTYYGEFADDASGTNGDGDGDKSE